MRQSYQVLGLFLLLATLSFAKTPSHKAVLLSTIKSLTLRGDQQTTARRVKAIPQLQCVGGNAKGLYHVDVMRCQNSGGEYDKEDIQWTCQSSLPPEFKLGSTDVVCEGYDSPDDPYVLKGSCGVEYRLVLTELGEEKYGAGGWGSFKVDASVGNDVSGTAYTVVFWLIFLGIIGFMLYKIFIERTNAGRNINDGFRRRYGRGGGGDGGGAGDDDDDPPPPYSPRPPPQSRAKTRSSQASNPRQSGPSATPWRPGFWTGAAAGTAAGYAMGGRNPNRSQTAQAGPSNWFNGGARQNNAPTGFFGGAGGSAPGSPASSPSASRYEGTGFGGTRRR